MTALLILGIVMLGLFIALIVQIARADARFADMAETCRRSNDVGRNNGAPGPATPASAAQGSGAFVARGWVRPCARCGHHHMHTGSLLCEACDGERKKGGAL